MLGRYMYASRVVFTCHVTAVSISMPFPVKLHLYDLSNGMARSMSLSIIGKQLDGIWHSGIAVYGVEYFYGGGICAAPAGRAIPHLPYQEISLGQTTKTQIELEVFLQSINSRFTQATYSLLRHNCNNFANEVAQFLLGSGIPEHIIRLPQEFLTSPMGAMLAPMIEGMEQRMRQEMVGGGHGLNPFGHIEGRTRLFNESSPAIAAPSAPVAVADTDPEGPMWLEGDSRLLSTAIEGVPSTVLADDLKKKIAVTDVTVVPELVQFMKKQFKLKVPILLSFATIARFYWKEQSFRHRLLSEAKEVVEGLFEACVGSDNSHLVSSAMALSVNVSAAIDAESFESLKRVILHHIVTLSSATVDLLSDTASASLKKMSLMTRYNFLLLVPFRDDTVDAISSLIQDSIRLLLEYKRISDPAHVVLLAKGLEVGCGRMADLAPGKFKSDATSAAALISVAEEIDSKFKVSLEKTISLLLDSDSS